MDNKADDSENEHFCRKNYYVEHHDLTFYSVLFYFYQHLGAERNQDLSIVLRVLVPMKLFSQT